MYAQDDLTKEIEELQEKFATKFGNDAFGLAEMSTFNAYLTQYKFDYLLGNKVKEYFNSPEVQERLKRIRSSTE